MAENSYIYILTNKTGSVLYTGVTTDLVRRVDAHKAGAVDGFTKRYNVNRLVYYEVHESLDSAATREKRIKGGSRARKLALIDGMNPTWKDLSEDL